MSRGYSRRRVVVMRKNIDLENLSRILVCPECKGPLAVVGEGVRCETEDLTFRVGPQDYLHFLSARPDTGQGTQEEYFELQHEGGAGPLERYVKPWLEKEPFHAVLDVGCGLGKGVSILAEEGYEAYGVDLPDLAKFWVRAGNDPNHFLVANGLQLPFPDETFDAIWSLGVIEHIGTIDGSALLAQDYQKHRERFASELLRVLKPSGRVLVSCPHKHFPIDIQHRPYLSSLLAPVNEWIFAKSNVMVHKTWGQYYLPSYREVEWWFNRPVEPLPLKGYFGFALFMRNEILRRFLKVTTLYVENLPASLRRTPLNPYMLAEIRK
jgi:SAM-dependent methyltransferase